MATARRLGCRIQLDAAGLATRTKIVAAQRPSSENIKGGGLSCQLTGHEAFPSEGKFWAQQTLCGATVFGCGKRVVAQRISRKIAEHYPAILRIRSQMMYLQGAGRTDVLHVRTA